MEGIAFSPVFYGAIRTNLIFPQNVCGICVSKGGGLAMCVLLGFNNLVFDN